MGYLHVSAILLYMSVLDGNIASNDGAIFVSTGAMTIYWSEFTHNKALAPPPPPGDAGVLYTYIISVNIKWCRFTFDEAGNNGGVMRLHNVINSVVVYIKDSVFSNNKADVGGAIFVREATLTIDLHNNNFTENCAKIGVMYVSESNISLSRNITITKNTDSLCLLSSKLIVTEKDAITAFNNFSPNVMATIHQEGGEITSILSK